MNDDWPLLEFGRPDRNRRSRLSPGRGKIHLPSVRQQGRRLDGLFAEIEGSFRSRSAALKVVGGDPELTLVLEIYGSVENFAAAVRRIEGLEWLAEEELQDLEPDDYFYDERKRGNTLPGRLFLIMSNQQALQELLRMWRLYQEHGADEKFSMARGLAPLKEVFTRLKNVRLWNESDRLYGTGLHEVWQDELAGNRESVIVEAELWFRNDEDARRKASAEVAALVRQGGGDVVKEVLYPEIAYHAVLARLPAMQARQFLEGGQLELVKCESLRFLRPSGQIADGGGMDSGDTEQTRVRVAAARALPSGEPMVALLDGVPQQNHTLLQGRIRIDDPDGFAVRYKSDEQVHGTGMASLVVHGDLNVQGEALSSPLYVRPIMAPDPHDTFHRPRDESVPEDLLLSEVLHEAVRRMFDSGSWGKAVAPGVRVINLSVGDRLRPFQNVLSPAAQMVDYLSWRYKVLFVISAGNHSGPWDLGMEMSQFKALSSLQQEQALVQAVWKERGARRLLSPAESVNALTVGALHADAAPVNPVQFPGIRFSLLNQNRPSPVSALGGGYRRAVKPDLLFSGGRIMFGEDLRWQGRGNYVVQRAGLALQNQPPGIYAAAPGQVSQTNAARYSCGSSNAAALITHEAVRCLMVLRQMYGTDLAAEHEAVLLKSMLVHGCSWGDNGDFIATSLGSLLTETIGRDGATRFLGYGVPEVAKVMSCAQTRATVLGYGRLADGEGVVYELPLPPSLNQRDAAFRLAVTLSWLTPIASRTCNYRQAALWAEVQGLWGRLRRTECCAGRNGWSTVRRGTVQHEVYAGSKQVSIQPGDVLRIKVNCREYAPDLTESVPYGLVVTLECAPELRIPLYQEIRTALRAKIVTGIKPSVL
ncbi:MAG: S8 family peptidase [Succinivibrio sp.]|nr:S8 family peptidase [Succinivibrio sp.]